MLREAEDVLDRRDVGRVRRARMPVVPELRDLRLHLRGEVRTELAVHEPAAGAVARMHFPLEELCKLVRVNALALVYAVVDLVRPSPDSHQQREPDADLVPLHLNGTRAEVRVAVRTVRRGDIDRALVRVKPVIYANTSGTDTRNAHTTTMLTCARARDVKHAKSTAELLTPHMPKRARRGSAPLIPAGGARSH